MIDMPSGYDWCDNTETDGRKTAKALRPRHSNRWRRIGGHRVRVMKKLDQSKVEHTVAEKKKCIENKIIAESVNTIAQYIQKLCARFKSAPEGNRTFPARAGGLLGNLQPEESRLPRPPPAAPSNPGRVKHENVPECPEWPFPRALYTPHCWNPASGQVEEKANAPQADAARAYARRLHAAHGPQAARRRAPSHIMPGRRIPLHRMAGRV